MFSTPLIERHNGYRMAAVTVVLGRPAADSLSMMDDIRVVAEAHTSAEIIRAVLRHRPDVLVLDPYLEHDDGITTIRDVVEAAPGTAVLVWSDVDDDVSVRSAFRAGARGYLAKGGNTSLAPAIRGIAGGEVILGPSIASRIVMLLSTPAAMDTLTSREHEIVDLLRQGKSNAAIGRELYLAAKTVSNNLSSIYAKLQVTGRAEAIALLATG